MGPVAHSVNGRSQGSARLREGVLDPWRHGRMHAPLDRAAGGSASDNPAARGPYGMRSVLCHPGAQRRVRHLQKDGAGVDQ